MSEKEQTTQAAAYLRPKDLIDRLGVDKMVVYRAISDGTIPSFRLRPRGAILIPADVIDGLVQKFASAEAHNPEAA